MYLTSKECLQAVGFARGFIASKVGDLKLDEKKSAEEINPSLVWVCVYFHVFLSYSVANLLVTQWRNNAIFACSTVADSGADMMVDMLSSHLLRNEGTSKHSAVMVCTR